MSTKVASGPFDERTSKTLSTRPFLKDPSLPHLEVAEDPELMQEVFRRNLQPFNEGVYQLRGCQILHVRYQQARHRCVYQYNLRIAERDTGDGWDQWVTVMFDAEGRTRRTWKKLQRSDSRLTLAGHPSGFAPFSYIVDLDMLVQVFPFDRQLPALS